MQTTPVRKRLPSLISELNNLYSINLPNQLLLTTCDILFLYKIANHMMINGTISGTIDGMISGTIDGMIHGMISGTIDGMIHGMISGTIDGMHVAQS